MRKATIHESAIGSANSPKGIQAALTAAANDGAGCHYDKYGDLCGIDFDDGSQICLLIGHGGETHIWAEVL